MAENTNTPVEEGDPFGDPATGDFLNEEAMAELTGSNWLVRVHEYEPHIPTIHTKPGENSPAIRADVIVLDGKAKGRVYENTLIFGKVLIPQLKPRVGKMIVGRLDKGEKKPGKNAPWTLAKGDDKAKKLAREWLADHADDPFA